MGYTCEICGKPLGGRRRKLCLECATNPGKTANLKGEKNKAYTYAPGLSARANTKQCKTCRYWDKFNRWCDYLSITGEPRRCEPSPNCTKYERSKK